MTIDSTISNKSPRALAVARLKQLIHSGGLLRGAPLPPERELSQNLRLSRATIRRAVGILEREGMIRSVGGRTRMVSEVPQASRSALLKRAVVILAPNLERDPRHQQPGWAEWINQGVMQHLRSRGLHMLTLNPSNLGDEGLAQVLEDRPLGVVIPEVGRSTSLVGLLGQLTASAAHIPVVSYGQGPALERFDRVASDHERGAYELTRWLLGQGRRRPLLVLEKPLDHSWIVQRVAGYRRAMAETGVPLLEPLIAPPFPAEQQEPNADFFEAVSRYAAGLLVERLTGPEPVDAIIAISDGKIFPLARAAAILGKRIHEDIAIVGYDNYWQDSWERQFINVRPLATVDKRNFELGQAMAQLLLDRAAGNLPPEPQIHIFPPHLVTPT